MEVTEFDVSLGRLVTRTLSVEEEAELVAIQNRGPMDIVYNTQDTYADKIASVVAQFIARGYSESEAESLAASFVK